MLEIHPSEGGEDAELFAFELACAVSRYSGQPVERAGKVLELRCL